MVLFTGAALLVGLAIIAFAVLSRPAAPSDEIVGPAVIVPQHLAEGNALGSAAAPVTVEVWSDFQCPGCKSLAERVEPALIGQYVVPGVARLVYRDAAFQGQRAGRPYDESVEPAAAARCAAQQDLFWTMHGWIFANWNGENEGAFRAERLRAIAEAAGLDMAAYDACMATGQQQAAVRAETDQAVAAGIGVTPTLIISGEPYEGRLSAADIGAAIEAAAGDATPAPPTQSQ
jgi:protein-disulfide isomerase